MAVTTMTQAEWNQRGEALFGPDRMTWRFACPCCAHVASVRDWMNVGAPEGSIAFSCIGRWKLAAPREAFGGEGPGPCNYAGGGLFAINPVKVQRDDGAEQYVFAFDEPKQESA